MSDHYSNAGRRESGRGRIREGTVTRGLLLENPHMLKSHLFRGVAILLILTLGVPSTFAEQGA
jgi:hypothetical protein